MATKIGATTWLDESTWNSPNYTPAASVKTTYGMPRTIKGITIHHWGVDRQRYENVCNYLSRRGGNTSAHFVVEAGRAACLVSPANAAWHSGSAEGNATTIGIECRPEMSAADMASLVELIVWLEGIYGSLRIYGHKDWSNTACPGRYYAQLPSIISRVNAAHSKKTPATAPAATATTNTTTTKETTMAKVLDETLPGFNGKKISLRDYLRWGFSNILSRQDQIIQKLNALDKRSTKPAWRSPEEAAKNPKIGI